MDSPGKEGHSISSLSLFSSAFPALLLRPLNIGERERKAKNTIWPSSLFSPTQKFLKRMCRGSKERKRHRETDELGQRSLSVDRSSGMA